MIYIKYKCAFCVHFFEFPLEHPRSLWLKSRAMPGLRASRRPCRLEPGTPVQHLTHGIGKVVSEWGTLPVLEGGSRKVTDCKGIYDVEFVVGPHRVMHCCRSEYLQRIG